MAIAYREDVDGLRAVAVLGVVAYHLSPTLAPGGFVGVDVFFVISGYLITAIIAREAAQGRFSFLSFWARRARRILPALTVMVAASFVAGAFLLPPGQFRDFTISAVAALLFAANFHFKDQAGYFDAPAESHPLLHTWSLAVEEQFYLVWPLIIVLALRAPGWARAAILGALILGSLIAAEAMMADAPISVFYLLPFRLWELALGGALALALARPEGARLAAGLAPAAAQALSLTGLALVLGSIAALDQSTPFPGLSAAPACLGTALLIFSGAAARAPIGARLLGTAPMVAVGLASYSLYLWHWPVLVYHRLLNHGRPPEGWLEIAALLALSGLLAALSLRYVERPFRSEAARRFGDGRALLVAGAGVGAAALIALQAHLSGGWAWRAPAKVAHIEAAAVPSLRYRPCNLAIGSAPMTERIAACSFGAPRRGESFDMVLLGDSHVENVADMIVGYAERRGLSALVLYRSACAPIVTAEFEVKGRAGRCAAFQEQMRAALADNPEARLVVLAGRWSPFTAEAGDGAVGARQPVVVRDELTETVTPNDMRRVVRRGLRDMVARVSTETRAVVLLLEQVPEHPRNPVDCAIAAAWRDADPRDCRLPLAEDARLLGPHREILRAVAAESPRAVSVDIAPAFCQARGCVAYDAAGILYSDTNHLTAAASAKLGDALGFYARDFGAAGAAAVEGAGSGGSAR